MCFLCILRDTNDAKENHDAIVFTHTRTRIYSHAYSRARRACRYNLHRLSDASMTTHAHTHTHTHQMNAHIGVQFQFLITHCVHCISIRFNSIKTIYTRKSNEIVASQHSRVDDQKNKQRNKLYLRFLSCIIVGRMRTKIQIFDLRVKWFVRSRPVSVLCILY